MVAGLNDLETNRKADDGVINLILGSIAKIGNFFTDQSYVKSFGDIISVRDEAGLQRIISNYAQQPLPFRALMSWLARLVDDTQRKVDGKADFVDKQIQQLMINMPFLSDAICLLFSISIPIFLLAISAVLNRFDVNACSC